MKREVVEHINRAAARQYGVVTRRQLLDAGLSASALGRQLRSRWLRRLHAGVYLVGPVMVPRAREMAAVLAGGAGAVLSHLSAGKSWELLVAAHPKADLRSGRPGPVEEPADVTVADANRGRRPGIRVHRVVRLDPDERTVLEGMPITTPGRTLLDLAAMLGSRDLETAVARAERERLITHEGQSVLLARHRGRPGARALRAVLEAGSAPALTRSEAEAAFLALVRRAGLPVPDTNVRIGRYEVDFLWRSAGIAVEVDGFRHHSSRPRFEGDRRRDSWLVANGLIVVRLSWRQIVHEGTATAVRLAQALIRADTDRSARSALTTGPIH